MNTTLSIILGIILIVAAIFLIVAILLQNTKSKGTGVVTGGSTETYFGKNQKQSTDKKLALLTTIVAIVFVLCVIIAFVAQDYNLVYPEMPITTGSGSNTGSGSDDLVKDTATSSDDLVADSATSSDDLVKDTGDLGEDNGND